MQPKTFIFEGYSFDESRLQATFNYSFDGELSFTETVLFADIKPDYDKQVLDRALRLAFFVAGTSYYKTFPTTGVAMRQALSEQQATFLNEVYQEGMSQFAFENNLTRDQLAHFTATDGEAQQPVEYAGKGSIAMQSGGKDSLLLASLLNRSHTDFTSLFVSSTEVYPGVIDMIGRSVALVRRQLDKAGLERAKNLGGLNGHVPVTYIVASYALIQAVLTGKNTVLLAIGHEGEEPHEMIGDLPVMHQWSKTWRAEQQLVGYIKQNISPDLRVGSPLRQFSELRIAELFVDHAWPVFGRDFSSCNLGNYKQGQLNGQLTWCGECPKCANNFLLFAPFIEPNELMGLFDGQNLYEKETLKEVFKGLLGIDGVMKPLECVGEVEELRVAYRMARAQWGSDVYSLPFEVPMSEFDYKKEYESQDWARALAGELA